ncbi:DUF6252 family protein [Paracrocinitomix mangrovi]|uniref:DUF6252 family protein n=1 Tax=Paracrocinitomix mangrovi TaxID=2862509 RepID=UPI001C8DD70B|nr:DUF6252 family protein [Paracrocinitomix mangrovi]UKN00890.1 DUF6252 family protein [Paracrocinitomix mangrovi]
MREGLLWILSLLMLGACSKTNSENILPDATSNGLHTMGFYLNGETWLPYDKGNYKDHELPHPTITNDGGLRISATRIDDQQSARNWFCIEVPQGCFEVGRYDLASEYCTAPYQTFYYGSNSHKSAEYYEIDTLSPHFIDITNYNKEDQIISGTFEFDAISAQKDTLQFRSGRFDLHYKTL